MNYEEKLAALEHLRDITAKYVAGGFASLGETQALRQELFETYGNVSDAFEAVVGKQRIEVPLSGSGGKVSYYPNFFEAGFMSGRSFHTSQGQAELFKVIGRVRELAKNNQINKPVIKSNPVIATRFNVYIKTFMGIFNLFDLTEEKLEKLVEAYHMGKDSVTLSGNKYIISNVSSIQIYTYNSNGISNPEEYLTGQGLLTSSYGGSYFSPQALMKIGDNVTDNYIINDYGSFKKEENKTNSGMESKIKIFVSHKESDKILANALGAFLIDSLKIEREEIRISSVPGFQLSFKSSGKDQLREDLRASKVLLAILTEASLASTWVLMELGAAWALETPLIIPLLGVGLAENVLPGPLDRPAIKFADEASARERLRDAIREISEETGCPERGGAAAERALSQLAEVFKNEKTKFIS